MSDPKLDLDARVARLETLIEVLHKDLTDFRPGISRDVHSLSASVQTLAETVRMTHLDHERRISKLELNGSKLMWAVMMLAGAGGASGSAIIKFLGG